VEYDLEYRPLKAMKGQVVADFIVDHDIEIEADVCVVEEGLWKLFFDRSMCSRAQGISCFIVSPGGAEQEMSIHLEFCYTNNQAKYEGLLTGLEMMKPLGVQRVQIFGDSKLVIQQLNGEAQCLDGVLNEYRERCMAIMDDIDSVSVEHVQREDNARANALAQQALGYDIRRGRFEVRKELGSGEVLIIQGNEAECSARRLMESIDRMH
jgi:ribonuclease HI